LDFEKDDIGLPSKDGLDAAQSLDGSDQKEYKRFGGEGMADANESPYGDPYKLRLSHLTVTPADLSPASASESGTHKAKSARILRR